MHTLTQLDRDGVGRARRVVLAGVLQRDPVRTGVAGPAPDRVVVSAGLAGPLEGRGQVDLAAAGRAFLGVLDTLKTQHRERGWLRWDQWVLYWATPGGVREGSTHDDGIVPEDRWQDLLRRLGDDVDHVSLTSGSWGELVLGAPALAFPQAPTTAAQAWVRTPAEGAQAVADALLAVVRDGHDAATGYVHVDSVADPYDAAVRDGRLSRDDFTTQVHGYYWAVRLGPGHLDLLGGPSVVASSAPVGHVEEVDAGLLCVLTGDPSTVTEPQWRAWRRFLLPVLREGYPIGAEHVGTVGSPLRYPVWLFEGAPVDSLVRDVLLAGAEPPVPVPPVEVADDAIDPERPTCQLVPDEPPGDIGRATEDVRAVVTAWWATGVRGRLAGLDGTLHDCSEVTWDDDDGCWRWQVESHDVDIVAALELLAAALSVPDLPTCRLEVG